MVGLVAVRYGCSDGLYQARWGAFPLGTPRPPIRAQSGLVMRVYRVTGAHTVGNGKPRELSWKVGFIINLATLHTRGLRSVSRHIGRIFVSTAYSQDVLSGLRFLHTEALFIFDSEGPQIYKSCHLLSYGTKY